MFTDSGNTRRIRNIKKNREINEESRENSAEKHKNVVLLEKEM